VPSPKPSRREKRKKGGRGSGGGGRGGRRSSSRISENRLSMGAGGAGSLGDSEKGGGGMVVQQVGGGGGADAEVGLKPVGSWGRQYGQRQHTLGSIAETTEFGQEITNTGGRDDSTMPGSFPKVSTKRSFEDMDDRHHTEVRMSVKKVKLGEESNDDDSDDDDGGTMTSEDEVEGQVWSLPIEKAVVKATTT